MMPIVIAGLHRATLEDILLGNPPYNGPPRSFRFPLYLLLLYRIRTPDNVIIFTIVRSKSFG